VPHFDNEVVLKTTPVKDQGRSPLCWAYAMLATIETEHLMVGDSVNLSPTIPRVVPPQQAQRYFLTGGAQRVSLRACRRCSSD
jgi:bleomycin hydrolase